MVDDVAHGVEHLGGGEGQIFTLGAALSWVVDRVVQTLHVAIDETIGLSASVTKNANVASTELEVATLLRAFL